MVLQTPVSSNVPSERPERRVYIKEKKCKIFIILAVK